MKDLLNPRRPIKVFFLFVFVFVFVCLFGFFFECLWKKSNIAVLEHLSEIGAFGACANCIEIFGFYLNNDST